MRFVMIADGSPDIGYGHLMRTSSLAREALRHGDGVTYLTRTPDEAVDTLPPEISVVGVETYGEAVEWIQGNDVGAVVTDSYDVDTGLQERLSDVAPVLAVVTDDTRYTLCCDVAINGNAYAPELGYDWIGDEPEWLFGTDHLLMREEFRKLANETPPWRDQPERALVTFGGSDVNNVTPDVVRAFDGFDLSADVIIGPGFENEDEIETAARETGADFSLLRDPDGLPRRMFDADLAVSATGSTVYELLATGTPVIGTPQSDNQVPVADALDGNILRSDTDRVRSRLTELLENDFLRRNLRENGRRLVDGKGASRVYSAVISVES